MASALSLYNHSPRHLETREQDKSVVLRSLEWKSGESRSVVDSTLVLGIVDCLSLRREAPVLRVGHTFDQADYCESLAILEQNFLGTYRQNVALRRGRVRAVRRIVRHRLYCLV